LDYVPKVDAKNKSIKELYRDTEEIKCMLSFMTKEFQWITISKVNTQAYLGMNICVEENKVCVDMIFFIEQLLLEFDQVKDQPSPVVKSENIELLQQEQWKKFHTTTAKLLYLAKRARLDILRATSFLCTRAKVNMKSDQVKLLRLIVYLAATKVFKYIVKLSLPFRVQT
jgi:hypothetical protein